MAIVVRVHVAASPVPTIAPLRALRADVYCAVRADGEGNTYWSHWSVGAAGEFGGIDPNQNGIESGHDSQKVLLSAKLLRVSTIMFLEQSMPLILAAMNRKIKDMQEHTAVPRYRGEGPVADQQIVMNAKFLMEISPWFLEIDHPGENSRTLVVTANSTKMTAARRAAFMATIVGKEPPRMPKVNSMAKLDEVFAITHGCHIVNIHKVTESTMQNPFIAKANVTIGDDATPVAEDTEKLVQITCSCGVYKHTANYCTEVVAVAAELQLINLEMLLTAMAPRRAVGAPKGPRKNKKGKGKGGAASIKDKEKTTHTAQWFFGKLTTQVANGECMHYTGWDAAVEDAGGFVYVGVVQRYRKLPAGRDKGKVVWTVKYKLEDEGNQSEELDMRELANALARAYAEGKGGPHRDD